MRQRPHPDRGRQERPEWKCRSNEPTLHRSSNPRSKSSASSRLLTRARGDSGFASEKRGERTKGMAQNDSNLNPRRTLANGAGCAPKNKEAVKLLFVPFSPACVQWFGDRSFPYVVRLRTFANTRARLPGMAHEDADGVRESRKTSVAWASPICWYCKRWCARSVHSAPDRWTLASS